MPKIAFYISGHGLGHTMRMKVVMERLLARDPSVKLFVMGNMPAWVFTERPLLGVRRRMLRCDVGAVQGDSLTLDVRRTLEENARFFVGIEPLVAGEAEFLERKKIDLVVGDIPPLAFLAAARAGRESIAIGNFSWDWIYEDYVRKFPRYACIVDLVQKAYRRASLLLRLPFHGDMAVFRAVKDIPLITRISRTPPDETRRALGIGREEKRKVVFVSMGGHRNEEIVRGEESDMGDYLFVSYFPLDIRRKNCILLRNRAALPHPDIVRASDLVISKPGYCTVAECIANRTALMYTTRDSFREFPVLEAAIKAHLPWAELPREQFHAGAWRPCLDAFFARAGDFPWTKIALNGADEAARTILEVVKG